MRTTEYFVRAYDPKTLTVRQVMEDAVYTVSPDSEGIAIAEIMTDRNFGSVPVVEGDSTLIGLVSESDLLRVIEEGKDLRHIKAEQMMTRNVVTVTEEMLVKDLIHLLQERHLIRAPVVRGKTLVGIVSRRDAVFGYLKALDIMRTTEYFVRAYDPKTLTVRQVMENAVYTVTPDSKGIAIAEIMTDRNFGSVPVVEGDSTLIGLVSESDLLRVIEEGKDLRHIKADEMMTRNVVTVTEEMLVKDLIHLLQERHLIRAPVVRGKTLVGIVSRRDAVFGYLKATAKSWGPRKAGA